MRRREKKDLSGHRIPAEIISADLWVKDSHPGVDTTFSVWLKFDDRTSQSFGWYKMDDDLMKKFGHDLLSLFGVISAELLCGKSCFALKDFSGGSGEDIVGLETEDGKRIVMRDWFSRNLPGYEREDPLEERKKLLRATVKSAECKKNEAEKRLANVEESFHLWTDREDPSEKRRFFVDGEQFWARTQNIRGSDARRIARVPHTAALYLEVATADVDARIEADTELSLASDLPVRLYTLLPEKKERYAFFVDGVKYHTTSSGLIGWEVMEFVQDDMEECMLWVEGNPTDSAGEDRVVHNHDAFYLDGFSPVKFYTTSRKEERTRTGGKFHFYVNDVRHTTEFSELRGSEIMALAGLDEDELDLFLQCSIRRDDTDIAINPEKRVDLRTFHTPPYFYTIPKRRNGL